MRYQVTVGYVTVTTHVGAGRARIDVPYGTTLPDDVPAEDIDRLLRLGHIKAAESAEHDPAPDPNADGGVPAGPIAVVLQWVGDDTDRARAALDAEQAKGDQGRKSLIEALAKLAESE